MDIINEDIFGHFKGSILQAEYDKLLQIEYVTSQLIHGHSLTKIAKNNDISITKVSRIRKKYFPTLPIPTRDGKGAARARKAQAHRWSELNKRDKRIVRMLQTQTYAVVAEKNNVSIGTIHNIAHYYADYLRERKITKKPHKGG